MEVRSREGSPGVAVGLSVAYSGGKLMVVECSKLAGGEGKLVLTGHLGHVMRESARLAFNWVRSVAYQVLNPNTTNKRFKFMKYIF